jgi:anti-anti-sigma regulatory factor
LESDALFIRIGRDEAALTISCRGELDISNRSSLAEASELALNEQPSRLRLDCSQLGFFSLDSLQLLLDAAARSEELGVELELLLPRRTWQVVDLLGVEEWARLTSCRAPEPASHKSELAAVGRRCRRSPSRRPRRGPPGAVSA